MKEYDLEVKKSGYADPYDEEINPDIINGFAVAAFR